MINQNKSNAVNAYDVDPTLLPEVDFLKAANDEAGGSPLQLKEYTIARDINEWCVTEKRIKIEAYSLDHALHIVNGVLDDDFYDGEYGCWYVYDEATDYGTPELWNEVVVVKNTAQKKNNAESQNESSKNSQSSSGHIHLVLKTENT